MPSSNGVINLESKVFHPLSLFAAYQGAGTGAEPANQPFLRVTTCIR
jgi:hypothetical protein